MKRLISGEMPLAEAATPNAIPNGMMTTAIGAISTQPRHTPFAVKHGRPVRSATSVCSTMAPFESEARVWSIRDFKRGHLPPLARRSRSVNRRVHDLLFGGLERRKLLDHL